MVIAAAAALVLSVLGTAAPASAVATVDTVAQLSVTPVGNILVGTPITLTVAAHATPEPAGVVKTYDNGKVLYNKLVSGGVVGLIPAVRPSVGKHVYSAVFVPTDTSTYKISPAVSLTIVVVGLPTQVTLGITPRPHVSIGDPITLTAGVSRRIPGVVAFLGDGKSLRRVIPVNGLARLVVVPTLGHHVYRAVFLPTSPTYARSVSVARSAAVTVPPATIPLRPGARGPLVILAQQRLVFSGIMVRVTGTYDAATVAAVKRLQGKFFYSQTGVVDARTMSLLKGLALVRLPTQCTTAARAICVDKTRKILQYVINGRIRYSIDARFGNEAAGLATKEGLFSVFRKTGAHHLSTLYHTDMPWAMFFSGGQAVHYSMYFAAVGYNGASHGCVNTRDYNTIHTIWLQTPIGTRVFIYRS